jgi:hypothetical protein
MRNLANESGIFEGLHLSQKTVPEGHCQVHKFCFNWTRMKGLRAAASGGMRASLLPNIQICKADHVKHSVGHLNCFDFEVSKWLHLALEVFGDGYRILK